MLQFPLKLMGRTMYSSPTNTPGEYSITLNTTTLSQLPVLSQYPL